MNIGKSTLDYVYFEKLAVEALRLLRLRAPSCGTNGHGPVIQAQALALKEVTNAAVNDRLSTFRR